MESGEICYSGTVLILLDRGRGVQARSEELGFCVGYVCLTVRFYLNKELDMLFQGRGTSMSQRATLIGSYFRRATFLISALNTQFYVANLVNILSELFFVKSETFSPFLCHEYSI